MKTVHIVVLAMATIALAGCIQEPLEIDEDPEAEGGGEGGEGSGAAGPGGTTPAAGGGGLPDAIQEEGTMTASADPFNLAMQGICGPTASCPKFPFELARTAHVEARLTWELPTNDLDLYIQKDGVIVENSVDAPPETQESISADLQRGTYEVVVVGWLVTQETYKVDVQFS